MKAAKHQKSVTGIMAAYIISSVMAAWQQWQE